MNRKLIPLIAAALALTAGLATYLGIGRQDAGPVLMTVLSAPRPLPDLRLVDQDGQAFTEEQFRGRWSVLFFGFTHCPDICPMTLYDLGSFSESLSDLPEGQQPGVFFVSVDPARDTPERLNDYVRTFNSSFRGITGEEAQIARLAATLGVAHGQVPDDAGGYTVLHTAALFFLDREGRFIGVSSAPHDVEALARDYRALVAPSGG